MIRSVSRLLPLCFCIAPLVSACAARETPEQKTFNARAVIDVAAVVEGMVLANALLFGILRSKNRVNICSMIMGTFFGLIVSVIIIVSVPINVQYLVIGGIAGLGTNLIPSRNQAATMKTAVGSLAKLVLATTSAIGSAAKDTGLPTPSEIALTIGFWWFFGTILLTLAIGNALSGMTLWGGN